jgi:hypothetical protein
MASNEASKQMPTMIRDFGFVLPIDANSVQ